MCTFGSDASLNVKLLFLKGVSVGGGLGASGGVGGDISAHVGAGVGIGLVLCVGESGVGLGVTEGEDASLGLGGCFALFRN